MVYRFLVLVATYCLPGSHGHINSQQQATGNYKPTTKDQKPTRKTALLASRFLYYFGRKSTVVKTPIFFFLLCCTVQFSKAQSMAQVSIDTGALIPQKENIITTSTIIRTENLGPNINTALPELRPTVSADGNLLFFIVENDPMNTKYNSI